MTSTSSEQDSVVRTYFGLRLAMVLLVVLLFAAVIVQVLTGTPGCFQSSLSAYYYTPVRPVFVAALSAVGVCLILYRGSTDIENVALNFSGFLAIVVAFVPTRYGIACDQTNVPTPTELFAASWDNVLALFVVGFLSLGAGLIVNRGRPRSPLAIATGVVTVLALVAGLVVFALAPALFEEYGHTTSAAALFVGIVLVVVVNAVIADTAGYKITYTVLAVALPVGGVLAWLLGGDRHRVFWVETVLIALFAVFWAVQTFELRNVGLRAAPAGGGRFGRYWTAAPVPTR